MVKIVTETYIQNERGFHYKVGDDIAFKYNGVPYIGIIKSIADTSFVCKAVLKNQLKTDDTEFNIEDVTDLTYTSWD